ncbi:hypothetical protein Csp2054_09350 [Curtobacterium sp. 'Ferrero']|nr:hypothetical protein Csp2054_09350 [Curtobacterium sp. 'Ferrero']
MPSAADVQRDAVQFLSRSEQVVNVPWKDIPEPILEQCDDGVRFVYSAVVTVDNDAKANAAELAMFWRSEGLSVSPSVTDFGSRGNTIYAATAHRDSGPRAAYQLSVISVAIEITSECAPGAVDDDDE